MRKLLLTTTALAVTAGAAAAEVTLSGAAGMGVAGSKGDSTRFHTDVNVTFTMSGETDGGLTFGTAIDLSEVNEESGTRAKTAAASGGDTVDAATGQDDEHGGIAVFLKGPFGNLNLGDTDGGFDWAMAEVGIGGSIRDNQEHGAYNGNSGLDGQHDGQILRYDHAIGDLGIAFSVELADEIGVVEAMPGARGAVDTTPPVAGSTSPLDNGKGKAIFGFGTKYSMAMPGGGSVGLGVGYQAGKADTAVVSRAAFTAAQNDQTLIAAANATPPGTGDRLLTVANGGLVRDYDAKMTAIGASVSLDTGAGLQAILNWSKKDTEASVMDAGVNPLAIDDVTLTGKGSVTHVGIGLGYTTGPVTLGANWGSSKTDAAVSFDRDASITSTELTAADGTNGATRPDVTFNPDKKVTGFGVTANYDLGGGAVLQFGVGSSETTQTVLFLDANSAGGATDAALTAAETKSDSNSWSLGLAFSF